MTVPMMAGQSVYDVVLLRSALAFTPHQLELNVNERMGRDHDHGGTVLGPAQFTVCMDQESSATEYAAFWYVGFLEPAD